MHSVVALLAFLLGKCFASKVILVSLDGFRHDYIEIAKQNKVNVSAFEYLESQGFRGMQVLSVMPSLTFPSHFSLVTGRYPEHHGLVGNNFYDPNLKDNYAYKNTSRQMESKWFTDNNNEPIWLSVQRQGGKSGVFYWPGSGSRMYDKMEYVSYGLYSTEPKIEFRVDRVMDWITKPDVNFVAMYFNEPDSAGHRGGPYSPNVRSALEKCNNGIAYLIDRINNSPELTEKPNIIITSDHGMTTVNMTHKVIPVHQYLPLDDYLSGVDASPATLGVWPKENGLSVDELYTKLKKVETEFGYCKVYKKEEIPAEYRYQNNNRIAPIVLIADEGWLVQENASDPYTGSLNGMHGYNNSLPDMHPFIVAAGPDIRKLGRVDFFHQVDVYALVMLLLKYYEPAVVDSDVMRVATFVKTLPSMDVLKQFDRYAKGLDPLPGVSSILGANIVLMLILVFSIQIILRH